MKHLIFYLIKTLTYVSIVWIGVGLVINHTSANELAIKITSNTELSGTQWRLVEFQSMDDKTGVLRPSDPSLYKMSLHSDGRVDMHLNCNRAKGNWTATPSGGGKSGNFEFGPLAATRAICPPPSMDEQIVIHAEYVRGYLLKDGRLYLSLMADGGIYTWEPDSDNKAIKDIYVAPEDGGPRDWEVTGLKNGMLNLRERPSTKAKIIDKYALGIILDNLGCQTGEGQIWCDVQKLGGGARGYVSSKFLKPAVSPDGSTATGPDDSAFRAGQNKFDATGTVSCSLFDDPAIKECEFGVARAGGGYATVVIAKPDGRKRALYFRMGKAIGADTSQADGYPKFRSSKESDWNLIHLGKEFYKIPDAVIFGS